MYGAGILARKQAGNTHMTRLLEAFEADGYHFRIVGDQLAIEAAEHLLNVQALDQLRAHKRELLAEVALRNFVRLVQAAAIHDQQVYFELADIEAELDRDDLHDMITLEREDLQVWAAMLAYRMFRERVESRH